MIQTLIVDDEPRARTTLRVQLEPQPDFEVVAEAANGREAIDMIREHAPDLVFLDIKMPGISGFDVLRALDPEELPFVVFVTAYDQYALEAFEVNALAYLLKPFDDVRLGEVLDRCRRLLAGSDAAGPDPDELVARLRELLDTRAAEGGKGSTAGDAGDRVVADRLIVKSSSRTKLVPVETIDWIEAAGNYARLHCAGGEDRHLINRSLRELEETLDARFVRVHRSTIVNLDRITELRTENYRDYQIVLESGQTLRMSRTYRDAVEEALGDAI